MSDPLFVFAFFGILGFGLALAAWSAGPPSPRPPYLPVSSVAAGPPCPHTWSPWAPAIRILRGPYGRTEDEVQRRTCTACGWTQQEDIEAYPPGRGRQDEEA